MTAVYAVVLLIGVIALIAWIALSVVAGSVDGWDRFDPEAAFGSWGRRLVAGLVGLGMAGMSATFAGWPSTLAAAAALGGGIALALASDWLRTTGS